MYILKKQCQEKNDTEFEMKLGVSFDDLPSYDAKYHFKCFNTYMRDRKSTNIKYYINEATSNVNKTMRACNLSSN